MPVRPRPSLNALRAVAAWLANHQREDRAQLVRDAADELERRRQDQAKDTP